MTKQGFGKLASLAEAYRIIENIVGKSEVITVDLSQANGMILAKDIVSKMNVPDFRKSAMDGFGVIVEDTFGASNNNPKTLKIIESVTAGVVPKKDIKSGECIEITTGAPLPKSATAVLMVEFTEKETKDNGEIIRYYKTLAPGENVIKIGSDVKENEVLLKKGTKLNPRLMGAISAIGLNKIEVFKFPTIGYFSTGSEIISTNEKLLPGKVFDINSTTIVETLKENNVPVKFYGVIPDNKEKIKNIILKSIEENDITLLSGGSSLGGEDFMVDSVKELGEVLVHGIASKPGKPVLIGKIKEKLILGLPGYPTSALSNTYSLVLPVIYQMMGAKYERNKVKAKLSRKIASTIGRFEFLPIMLKEDIESESLIAIPVMKGSSSITTMSESVGYITIDENTEVVNKDDEVWVNLY